MKKKMLTLMIVLVTVLAMLPAVHLLAEATELPKLAAPTDVEWGYRIKHQWNTTTQTYEWVKISAPGWFVFNTANPHQNLFRVELYQVGNEEPVSYVICDYSTSHNKGTQWLDNSFFLSLIDNEGSGTYYITVVAEGDGINFDDSYPAKSDDWTYVKPEAKLGNCTNLAWSGTETSWELPENAGGYEVELFFASTQNAEPAFVQLHQYPFSLDTPYASTDWIDDPIAFYSGVGYYYFRVRALSPDINTWCNGDWSEMCGPYYLDTTPVNKDLEEILANSVTGNEVLEAMQLMDTQALKEALLADQQTADNMVLLEEKVGGAAAVEVSQEAAVFEAGVISIVGANLNKSSADAQDVTLVIDKPEKEHILPTQYNNSVAVKFSMDLENVENTENLAVPVKITLPVPTNINPNFLVILHYHADGSVENIWPHIEATDGKTYASFVLTSFSDFTMTELVDTGTPLPPTDETEPSTTPTNPEPTEPKPTEPESTEPKPTEPKPTEPKPTESDPTTPPENDNIFVDVMQDAYYFEPVQWAVANGITNGLSADSFGPDATCTRAQIVTFLWRACGSPAPTAGNNPFTDVPAGQWYTDAVLWAVEKGITTGTSDTTFSPDAGCTRGQVATFLWRSQTTPASVMPVNSFTDIDPNAYYYNAVLWAVENGITNGLSATAFGPDATCTRGQIVTFLYRNDSVQQHINRYTFHCEDISWSEANARAEAMGGHLVHLNSIGEMGYLMARIYEMDYESSSYILLGGKRALDETEYYWVDADGSKVGSSLNEKSSWENALWLMGEPSLGYAGEWEDVMSMAYSDKDGRWGWNDVPDDLPATLRKNDPSQLGTIVYIVEYED